MKILFRVYFNNDVYHDFNDKLANHFCADACIPNGMVLKDFSGNRYSAKHYQGIAGSIQEVIDVCKENGVGVQVSIEVPIKCGYDFPDDSAYFIRRKIETIFEDNNFTDFEFKLFDLNFIYAPKNTGNSDDVSVSILGTKSILKSGLWCRPLTYMYGNFGGSEYTMESGYGGTINNYKWIKVEELLGPFWLDGTKTVGDYLEKGYPTEFIRGKIPEEHTMLSMKEVKEHKNTFCDCGGKWVKRKTKWNKEFTGCSNFPECRRTK